MTRRSAAPRARRFRGPAGRPAATAARGARRPRPHDAVVHTVDAKRPRAEAVAVRGRRIVAVGTNADVQRARGPETRVLDLAGRTVVPGFDDSHAHLLGIGFARLDVDLVGTRTFAEVVGAGGRGAEGPPAGRVGPRPRLARGQVGRAGAGRGARLPDPRGALSAVSPDEPRRPRAGRRPRRPRERAGDGARGHLAGDEGARGRRDHPRRAPASRPACSWTTRSRSSRPPSARGTRCARSLELAMDECLAKGVTSLTDAGAPTRGDRPLPQAAAAGTAAHPPLRDGGGPRRR